MGTVIEHFKNYEAGSAYVILFFATMLYILVRRRKEKNVFYFAIVALMYLVLVILNPLVAKFLNEYMGFGDVYWRLFWLFPVTIIIAYTATVILENGRKGFQKFLFAVMIIIIAVSGRCIYMNTPYAMAENSYKLPQDVVDVSDIILDSGEEEIRAIVPSELCWTIRQYTGKIKLLYGRNKATMMAPEELDVLYDQVNSDEPDMEIVLQYARKYQCNFLVLPNEAKMVAEEDGCVLFGQTVNYRIYKLQ